MRALDPNVARVNTWILHSKPLSEQMSWTETRQAIEFNGHIHVLSKTGPVFQCAHCGFHDNDTMIVEVLRFFKEMFDIDPFEIEVTVTANVNSKS